MMYVGGAGRGGGAFMMVFCAPAAAKTPECVTFALSHDSCGDPISTASGAMNRASIE